MGKTKQGNEIVCKGYDKLCELIMVNCPDAKVRLNGKDYAVNPKNMKKFLYEKWFKDQANEITLMNARWLYDQPYTRVNHEGEVAFEGERLIVHEKGLDRVIRLLQNKRVKLPKGRKDPKVPDLTVKQIDRLRDLQVEIKSNLKDYVIVGANLIEIQKLLEIKGQRLGEYTKKHFGFDYPRACQYFKAVKTVCDICKTDIGTLKVYRGILLKGHLTKTLPADRLLEGKSETERMKELIQPKYEESILETVRKREAMKGGSSATNNDIGRILLFLDSERKVRAIEGLTVEQQGELVDKLMTVQIERGGNMTESDIKSYVEEYKTGNTLLYESDILKQKTQSELNTIRNKLKKLAASNLKSTDFLLSRSRLFIR